MDVRVLVIGDDSLARGGIAALLAGRPGLVVALAEAAHDDAGLSPSGLRADLVVFDLGSGSPSGLERIHDLSRGGVVVLALARGASDARQAWAAGARGVVFRDRDAEALAAAVRAVARGLAVIEPDAVESPRRPPAAEAALVEPLTPRELETLRLLSEGLSNKAIAERLGIADRTAKFHVNAILAKLGARSRTEALVRAARLGLVVF
jgi:DNA-binding NarL/FixJ family response regulator